MRNPFYLSLNATVLAAGLILSARSSAPAQLLATLTNRLAQSGSDTGITRQPALRQPAGTSLVQVLRVLEQHYQTRFVYEAILLDSRVTRDELVVQPSEALDAVLARLLKPQQLQAIRLKNTRTRSSGYAILSDSVQTPTEPVIPSKTATNPIPTESPVREQGSVLNGPVTPLNHVAISVVEAKAITVSGQVTEENGKGLPGVNVALKGTTTGTISDANGSYKLAIPDDQADGTLVFSSIGYMRQEMLLRGRTTLNITLAADTKTLNEVVVVGYGTQQRRDLTGSIASVSSQQIKDLPVTNVEQAMAGQMAGVNVRQVSGQPGGGVVVRVRGTGSISASNDPLYVIDGLPVEVSATQINNPLSFLNPSDIESIDVLKDASAAAIYGSRAANGVVIITTKKGKAGIARFEFDSYAGVQKVLKKVDLLSANEFAQLAIEARTNAHLQAGGLITDPQTKWTPMNRLQYWQDFLASGSTGTDWQNEVFQEAPQQSYQLTVSGGTDKVTYRVAGSYFDQEGIVINSNFRRYSLRSNVQADLTNRLKVGVNLNPVYTVQRGIPAEGRVHSRVTGVIISALEQNPLLPVYDPSRESGYSSGINFGSGMQNNENAVAKAELIDDFRYTGRLLGNAFLDYRILDGLSFRLNAGGNFSSSRREEFIPGSIGQFGSRETGRTAIGTSGEENLNWQTAYLLTYVRRFKNNHSLNAVGGYEVQYNLNRGYGVAISNAPNNLLSIVDNTLNPTDAGLTGGSTKSEWSLLSWIGRVNYNINGRYLLTATIRRDGSSRFSDGQKWGTFPSVSAAWVVSEEPFLKGIRHISNLKLKMSYGFTGNNNIGNYQFARNMTGQGYVFGAGLGTIAQGFATSSPGNSNLTWETNKQTDVGLELGLFGDRISFSADYYNRISTDLLLNVNLPRQSGFAQQFQNIGTVQNNGLEFSLNTLNMSSTQFQWKTGANISFNRNKVLALDGERDFLESTVIANASHRTYVGQPMGMFYGMVTDGIFMNEEELKAYPSIPGTRPGDFRFVDIDGNGVINVNDRKIIGNPWPKAIFGMTNSFSFRGLDLSILLQGSYGNDLLNIFHYNGGYRASRNHLRDRSINRWQSIDQTGDGKTPRFIMSGRATVSGVISTDDLEDGSFLNVRNITLGYTFPSKWLNSIRLRTARLYASTQNAFLFTKYSMYNPEASMSNNPDGGGEGGFNTLGPGVDYGSYPIPRVFTLGLNISF